MLIALDAMGGDNAPKEIVLGADTARRKYNCSIFLTGDQESIQTILKEAGISDKIAIYNPDSTAELETYKEGGWLIIYHTTQVIDMHEDPLSAVRTKKDSSMVVATRLVKDGICDAVISAGSTGAMATISSVMLRRIKGASLAIATPIPTPKGVTLLLDSGAIVDAKPADFVNMAIMGSIYHQLVFHTDKPKIGLLNIGEEDTKGNKQVLASYPLLQDCKEINFIGNVEGRDIAHGVSDVVVCDGFVGNVVLKVAEGLAKVIINLIKEAITNAGLLTKIGALLVKPALKVVSQRLDPDEYGGAPLLGVTKPSIICHGSSSRKSISSAIGTTCEFVENDVLTKIKAALENANTAGEDKETKA